jgi:hypothetical protein
MEQYIFAFSLIIEGSTKKKLQFIIPFTFTIYNQYPGYIEKCIFERYREVQTIKNLLTILSWNFFLITFSELPAIVLR